MASADWAKVEARGGEVVRPVPWKLALTAAAAAAGAVFAGAIVALFVSDGLSRGDVVWVIAWSSLATLWTVFAFRNVVNLVRRQPVVGYDTTGLHLPGVGAVAWNEVSAVQVDEVGRGRAARPLLGIYLHEPHSVLARCSWRRRIEGRIEASARRAPLAVHHHKLPLELYALQQRIERRRQSAIGSRPERAAGSPH
ncbi:MAG: hypothetical protein M3524_07825 [Actinomycetota bacterium]|nr:hypothetical protein [Actinomycetota bacterium]